MECDQGSLDCVVVQNVSMYCNSRCDRWKETKTGLGLDLHIVVKCVVVVLLKLSYFYLIHSYPIPSDMYKL